MGYERAFSANLAHSSAAAASLVAKAEPAILLKISGYNSGAAQFIQIHDVAALPADGAIPSIVVKSNATDNFEYYCSKNGLGFTYGIVICNSSTYATKTIGAADCFFQVEYA